MQTETLGQFLKREREFRGISLEKLSGMTRINPSVLKRIEEDNLNAAPQSIYLKSFLKTYASQLGLDTGEILGRYENQKPVLPSEPVSTVKEAPRSFPPWVFGAGLLLAVAAIVLVILRFKH
jgi:cytoskeletal protein RodZ